LNYINPLIKFNGFDLAILGVTTTWHGNRLVERIVYDANVILDILIEDHDMTAQEAYEYIDFNIIDTYLGPATPVLVWICQEDEIRDYTEGFWAPWDRENNVPVERGPDRANEQHPVEQDRVLRIHKKSGSRSTGSSHIEVSTLESKHRLSVVQNPTQLGVPLPGSDQ
jgi:hypothetical protein